MVTLCLVQSTVLEKCCQKHYKKKLAYQYEKKAFDAPKKFPELHRKKMISVWMEVLL